MRTTYTVNDIRNELEILYRNLTGRKEFTAGECDIVYSAIVDAYLLVLHEYGVANFQFIEQAVTVNTVANQNYVDLDEYVFKVKNGTVRIPAHSQLLGLADEQSILINDPEQVQVDMPTCYSYGNSGDPDIMRLMLWPTPDAVYEIKLTAFKYPPDALTEFPTYLTGAIKNKSKALGCLGLGIAQYSLAFDQAYEDMIAKVKDGYLDDGPRHVGRTCFKRATTSIEGRIA